jgi:hypothetical protein
MRPLSELQKIVLLTAYKAHRVRPKCDIDTSLPEILIKIYGFPCKFSISRTDTPSLIFDRKAIGIERYQAGYAVVSKCFKRLIDRKLAEKGSGRGFTCGYRRGIKLTGPGVALGESIWQERRKSRW